METEEIPIAGADTETAFITVHGLCVLAWAFVRHSAGNGLSTVKRMFSICIFVGRVCAKCNAARLLVVRVTWCTNSMFLLVM